VVLTYGALPVPVPVPTSLEKHDLLVAMTGSASAYNATRYNGLGHPAWLISSKYYPLDGLVVIKDRQYITGLLVYPKLPKGRLAALADLAEKAYFPLTP
jgi:hypothetical protein